MKDGNVNTLYTIGPAAKFLQVCPATLRIWERRGLVTPARLGKNRFYSLQDIDYLRRVRDLLQKKRVNIEGVKRILGTTHCWEIKKCRRSMREKCPVYAKYGA